MRLTADQVAAFRAGDEQLFRMVVQECSPRLMALLRSFASDGDDAWDLLQEVWSRAYAKRHTFRGDGPLLSWLYAVSRNVCLGMARTRRAVARAEAAHGAPPAPETPDEAADRASLRRSLRAAVMALPDRQRDVVVLRFLEGRSTRETARHLGIAEGTVKASLHHALKKLETSVEGYCDGSY